MTEKQYKKSVIGAPPGITRMLKDRPCGNKPFKRFAACLLRNPGHSRSPNAWAPPGITHKNPRRVGGEWRKRLISLIINQFKPQISNAIEVKLVWRRTIQVSSQFVNGCKPYSCKQPIKGFP